MKKTLFLSALLTLALGIFTGAQAKKVHTIGDSTMAPYSEDATVTRGWGMYFGNFLTNGWTSVNYARGGRDSRGGYNELWQNAKNSVEPGDYVLIQFAHNDEKIDGVDRDELYDYYMSHGMTSLAASMETRGTTPSTTYKQWLAKIVDEVEAKGAHAILVAPVCRSYFDSNGKIRRNGRHDLGDSFSILTENGIRENQSVAADNHLMDYPYHMAQLAQEKGVPFIDLTTATKTLYESYGDAKCHEQLFDGDGSTHFNTTGALLVARLCAQLMKEQGILSDDINVPVDLSVSPAVADLGQAYVGLTLTKELTLNGFGLSPSAGTIDIAVSGNIEISLNKQTWKTNLSVDYTSGTIVQTFYVRTIIMEPGDLSATITLSNGTQTIEVPVTATGASLATGEPVSVTWPLSQDGAFTLEGTAEAMAQTWSGMELKEYLDGAQHSQPVGGTWTAAEDDDPARYISFGLKATDDQPVNISAISMKVGAAGGDGMRCHVYYSTDNFNTRTTIWAPTAMADGTLYEVSAQPVLKLEGGQQLEVRIYPWYTENATGKTLCLKDVVISGTGEGGALENEAVSVTFPFHEGAAGQTATFGPGEQAPAWFKSSYVEVGKSLAYKGIGGVNTQTLFQPAQQDGAANDDNAVDFCFITKKGLVFTPTHVSFNTTRYGTDGGKVDVSWIDGEGNVTTIANGVVPARNNKTPNITYVSEDIVGANSTEGLCKLRLNLYSLGNTKQVGFADIVIEGTLLGSPQEARQCRLVVNLSDENAATLTITPSADIFDEGDEVILSLEENFGYHFSHWQDADGNTVSTDNPYTFNITDNTTLTAMFNQATTYALNLTLTEGARDNLVQIQPEGTFIDGKRMYEAGAEVLLTALNNKVLTFLGWEDNTTASERIVTMDSEKNLTANFSAADYIVGWDFYYDQPNRDRVADYKSDSENAGQLCLRNAAGNTSTWLTRGITNGSENGRWGARIWKNRSEGWYFEASFSTKGYRNIKVTSSLGCSYNTYRTNNLQYSTDGENFQTVATFDIAARGWYDMPDVALPADADEQDRVYIRWMPDRNSELIGAETDYDGLCISDVFVTAEAGALAEEQAVLVASNPEAGATGVSASGSIILNFDKKIKMGTGTATLDGEQLTPVISGKSAVFKYSRLKYNTTYTFTMPEGVLLSRSGNPVAATTITFTTMERTQPEARLYDAVVAQDGSGDYTTLQDAIDNAPAGRAKPWLIFVKNGQYKEHINIPSNKPYLHIIGQTRDKAVILDDKLCGGENGVHVSVGATVVVNANNVFFENITLENSWGHEKQAGPQALALNTQGDRIALNNVALLSYQDTWITTGTSNNRHYIKNSLIEGAVDFIYQSGNVYLDGDTLLINRPSGGYIVAPSHTADVQWGYVFQNNVIKPYPGMNVTDVWLGRPWHNSPKTVFINTQTFVNIPAKGWYNTMGGLPVLWADYNTVDADGNPVDLSQRESYYYYIDSNTGEKVEAFDVKNFLTDEEAAQYTVKNVMGGNDNWQPDLMCEACSAPQPQLRNGRLSWQPVPYAICYVITEGEEVVAFTTDTEYTAATGDDYKVQAVNEYGGLSLYGTASSTTATGVTISDRQEAETPEAFFFANGMQQSRPSRGINIIRMKDGSVKKVVK